MATERDREEREREEQQQAAVQAEEQAEEPGREAIATELLNKAHDELNKAAIEKQLTLKGASAREHIATALNIVERRPDKGMEALAKKSHTTRSASSDNP